ncbi:hypothetical protein V2W30_19020 [Streptomyces sp. Q6]|uniref:Uncharacterized protein n=1 Tax=Streptomyces citrinus TaxID=3118173 RepID=A0ACD5ADR1_9ACTN
MPALPVRRLATSALCASFLIGAAAPVFAADSADERVSRTVVSSAPVPDASALLGQVKTLKDTGGVLTPVTDLLDAVLKTKDGKLPADEAQKHADAVKTAIDAAKEPAAAVPVPKAPDAAVPDDAKALFDVKGDALTALQSAVDALVKAATAGDVTAVATQAPVVVTGLVNFVAATLLSGGLPAPDLPGLPALPQLPTSSVPVPPTPAVPETPALPQTPTLPQTPAVPQTPALPRPPHLLAASRLRRSRRPSPPRAAAPLPPAGSRHARALSYV